MLNNKIDKMIMEARKDNNKTLLMVLQAIKSEFSNIIHSRNELTEEKEIKILSKMFKERNEVANTYLVNNRPDLASSELKEAAEISKFLPEEVSEEAAEISKFIPKEVSEEEIEKETRVCIDKYISEYGTISMKNTKYIMTLVKKKYPNADGKIISKVIKEVCK